MQERIAVRLVVFTLLACFASQARATIIPPIGLAPSSEYQLIFATADTTNAESSDINYYNTFVTNQAALNPALPTTTWSAVASTDTVNAIANAPNYEIDGSFLPVYNTLGILVSSNANGGLYNGNGILVPVGEDQFGLIPADAVAWTGSTSTGVEWVTTGPHATDLGLGAASGFGGYGLAAKSGSLDTGSLWLQTGSGLSVTTIQTVYALSGVLTMPTPEPASLVLLGWAALLIGGMRFLRRREE